MSHDIKTNIVTVTAEDAERLLARNTRNRKVSRTALEQIKASLVRGEWKLNGEAVKVASDGTILDGQHRLYACVETGISFPTLLITGLEHDTQDTMDTGKVRSHADVLALNGYANATTLAATVVAIIRAERYSIKAAMSSSGGSAAWPVTRKQMLDRLDSEPTLTDIANFGKKYGRIGLSGRAASTLFYFFSKIDADDAEHFFSKILTGDGLERGNPILTLRNHLITLKDDSKGERNLRYVAAVTIKAWNKFREGEQLSQMKFRTGGANPEVFPEPR